MKDFSWCVAYIKGYIAARNNEPENNTYLDQYERQSYSNGYSWFGTQRGEELYKENLEYANKVIDENLHEWNDFKKKINSSKKVIKSSHDWKDFNKFSDILNKYLPASGEGETMASQVATAVSKLVYKWFNDGDVYDTTHQLKGWANDLSTYANWLYRYAGAKFLDEIEDAESESDYEDILYSLCENLAVPEKLVNWDNKPKVDSVYKCEGPFEFVDREDEDDDDYIVLRDEDRDDYIPDDEEDIESSRKSIKSSKDDEDDWDNLDDSEDSENTVSFTVEDAVYEAFPMASPHTIEIITKWYENEYAAEDFDDVSEFSDYISNDIYDMLDAATDVSEKNEVIKDLNNAGYIDYDEEEVGDWDEDDDDWNDEGSH